jgi:hypothetical protein
VIIITATGFLVGESPTLPGGNRQVCIMHFPLLLFLDLFYFRLLLYCLLYRLAMGARGLLVVEFDLWGTVNVN